MNRPAPDVSPDVPQDVPQGVPATVSAGNGLEALLASIAEAIESLVAWNLPAFQLAVERQREVCAYLDRHAEWRQAPNAAATARKVRELNRVYHRLLRHSMQWTRTLQSIFEAAGSPPPTGATVHFRG